MARINLIKLWRKRIGLQAGVYAEVSQAIEAALWGNFLWVTSLSGVGAITRSTIGEFRRA